MEHISNIQSSLVILFLTAAFILVIYFINEQERPTVISRIVEFIFYASTIVSSLAFFTAAYTEIATHAQFKIFLVNASGWFIVWCGVVGTTYLLRRG